MKQITGILLLLLFISCNSSKPEKERPESSSGAEISEFEFNKEMHNFGTLQAGEIAVFTFVFTNTGDHNLWINKVDTGCGCMSATYPKEPIKPGKEGKIEVEFDSSGLYGKQMKTITIEANVPEPKHLAIFAEVKNEQLEIKY